MRDEDFTFLGKWDQCRLNVFGSTNTQLPESGIPGIKVVKAAFDMMAFNSQGNEYRSQDITPQLVVQDSGEDDFEYCMQFPALGKIP